MEEYFEPIFVTTIRDMMEWNRSDVETEEVDFSVSNTDEVVFE